MKVHSFILASNTGRCQQTACTKFEDPKLNFIQRRITGVVCVPFNSLADALKAVWSGLVEFKNCVTDYSNCKNHFQEAINYFVLAKLFSINIVLSAVINTVNPGIYTDLLNTRPEPPQQIQSTPAEPIISEEELAEIRNELDLRNKELASLQDDFAATKQREVSLSGLLQAAHKELADTKAAHEKTKKAHQRTLSELAVQTKELNKPKEAQPAETSSDVTTLFSEPSNNESSSSMDSEPSSSIDFASFLSDTFAGDPNSFGRVQTNTPQKPSDTSETLTLKEKQQVARVLGFT